MTIKELEKELEEKKIELLRLKGEYGNCESCGEETHLYSSGLCWRCDYKRQEKAVRKEFEYLIGKKIIDIEVSSSEVYPQLYAIILDNKTRISPNAWSDPVSLEVENS